MTGSQNAVEWARGKVAGERGGGGIEAARCSCAEDRDDGRGRPCALQRQVPAVLRVRSGRASASVRLQRDGTFLLRRRDRCPQCTLHGQVQLLVLLPCLYSSGGGPAAGEGGGRQAALSAFRPGAGAHHTGGEPM